MITLKSQREIDMMKKAGRLLADTHKQVTKMINPGVTIWEIEEFVDGYLRKHGAISEQIGHNGYKYAICASINDDVCHGFPRKTPLKEGDIVTIDTVVNLHGYLADSAWSYPVGKVSNPTQKLLDVTKESLYKGIEQVK